MHPQFKKYFIPHAENKYHPHILHPKRALGYSAFFIGFKALLVAFVMLIPLPAFVTPDVLSVEQDRLVSLINAVRKAEGHQPLEVRSVLDRSAGLKANDMAVLQYFSHAGPDGHTLNYFLRQAGYAYAAAGENLAMGFFNASDVVEAWKKSPGHYANLIDSDYLELGTSMVSGLYTNIPTAYAVAHFGVPAKAIAPLVVAPPDAAPEPARPAQGTTGEQVLSKKVTTTEEPFPQPSSQSVTVQLSSIAFDSVQSAIGWQEVPGGILITPEVSLSGPVEKAVVEIQGTEIVLKPAPGTRLWRGTATMPVSREELFKVIVPGSLTVHGPNGQVINDVVAWNNPPLISPTPLQRYLAAERQVPVAASLFTFSRAVYGLFLALFAFALVALVAIEIRKQHPHIIVQTAGLLALLIILIVL